MSDNQNEHERIDAANDELRLMRELLCAKYDLVLEDDGDGWDYFVTRESVGRGARGGCSCKGEHSVLCIFNSALRDSFAPSLANVMRSANTFVATLSKDSPVTRAEGRAYRIKGLHHEVDDGSLV